MSAPMTAHPGFGGGEATTGSEPLAHRSVAGPGEHFPEQAYGCPICNDSGEAAPGSLCACTAGSVLFDLIHEYETKDMR